MKRFFVLSATILAAFTALAQPKLNKNNIDEVLSAMTNEEKVSLLVGSARTMFVNNIPTGTLHLVPGAAGGTRAIPRLGIPQTVLADGPAGVRISPDREGESRKYYATAFPVGTLLASSWDLELVKEVTTAMGNEVREYGVDVLLAPGMNIHRSILCGRNFEYFSEDPLLSGKIAAAYVNGIQSNGVGTSIKHFAVNNQETNRNENDAIVSQRALREIYLKNFEIAVKEAQPWTVMSSYNKINGEYTQQSHDLLTTILRDEWGFKGIVMTDWGSKANTLKSSKAGNDLMEPGNQAEMDRLIQAVNDGSLSQEELNRNVRRMLEYIVKTPRFAAYNYSDAPDTKAHAALVRRAGAEGMVLLKNDGVLPLSDESKIALYGVSSYDIIAGGTGSGNVNKEYVRSLKDGLEGDGFILDPAPISWYEKYIQYTRETMANNAKSGQKWGKEVLPEMEVSDKFITRIEESTDVAVITIGRNAGEGDDRKAIDGDFILTQTERQLLQFVCDTYHAASKKVIVVLNIGGVIETASWKHLPDAILLAWQPGMEGGAAIADILCGKVNPSGRLSTTFPMALFDSPIYSNFPYNYEKPSNNFWIAKPTELEKNVDFTRYEEGIYVGYRYFSTKGVEVSYPFGYGLSYTTFSYDKPIVKATAAGLEASITVTNTGNIAGKEVIELYVSAPSGGLDKPSLELKSFAKTKELKPGESQTVTMSVDSYSLASFDESSSSWVKAPGTYKIQFASNVEKINSSVYFKIKDEQSWEVHNVMAPTDK